MKVTVTEGSEILYKGETYKSGAELEVEGELLEVFLNAGAIVEVTSKKSKKKS